MASNTPNLSLYMKDPVAEGNDFFDVKTMMNDNWEKIDGFAGVMDGVKERLNTISRQDVTLQPSVQIMNATKVAPFQLTGLTGRMLVNLLGRMGNCESVGLWSSNTTIALDTANKTSGTGSFKITLGSVPATASASFLTTPSKKYIAIADVKNGNTSKVAISINGIAGAAGNEVTSASAFAPSVVRFAATDFFHILTITGTGASGNTFNMDSVRVYEVSDADYAAAATLTPAQVAAKWPYVDSVMPVRNPYAIRYGENLIPSFYEWTRGDRAKILNPYKLETVATVSVDQSNVYVPVSPGKVYTFTAKVNGRVTVVEVDDLGAETTVYSTTDNENRDVAVTFTTKTTTKRVRIYATNTGAGTFTLENPMLNIGSTAKPFKPREDSMFALQTDLYADPVTGANADTVFEKDGQYFKAKKWQGLTLDGNREWVQGEGGATGGVRQVKLVGGAAGAVAGSGIGTKFDGKILPQGSTGNTPDSNAVTAAGDIYFGIPVADSGWADSYSPTADEIKAYFLGWNMYYWNGTSAELYNNQGPKSWRKINNHGATTSTLPTTQIEPGLSKDGRFVYWEPYQLVYQLATPTVEPIVSEGQLSFIEGDNQVEVGTGIVLRESVKPSLYPSTTNRWMVNYIGLSSANNPLRNMPSKVLNVYGNNASEPYNWGVTTIGGTWYGNVYIDQLYAYAPEKAYSVTYIMSNSSPVVPFTGSYAANEKTLLADLVDGVQQNTARVSVLENKKADKDNPVWLYPTLLNGWADYDTARRPIAYYKDSMGWVHVQGYIKNGVSTANSVIYRFPKGYEPESPIEVAAVSSSGAGAAPSTLYVGSTSLQCNSSVGNSFLVIDFSYRAK
ncbi:hypothetical protein [Paenibacillus polymyxa]|uniref:hypothetical protein n=1 Tax=Paenibacillus polymyxa TaxID=1406 RepID=UPI0003D2A203|nr:hypothetical protein [Paenibacillus polymyxa]AHC18905.1 hypothetical protein X809_06555 [Paenibacillus polymyxa CR1]